MRGKRGKPTACTWHWFVFMDEALGQRRSSAVTFIHCLHPRGGIRAKCSGGETAGGNRGTYVGCPYWAGKADGDGEKACSAKQDKAKPPCQYFWKNVLFFCIHFCLERHLPICLKGLKYAMTYYTSIIHKPLMACANKGPFLYFTLYGPNALIEIKQK